MNPPPVLTQTVSAKPAQGTLDFAAKAKFKILEMAQCAQHALVSSGAVSGGGGTDQHLKFLSLQMELIQEVEALGAKLAKAQAELQASQLEALNWAQAAAAIPPLEINPHAVSKGVTQEQLKEILDAGWKWGHACASQPSQDVGQNDSPSIHSLRLVALNKVQDVLNHAKPLPYEQVQSHIVSMVGTWLEARIQELNKTRDSWQHSVESEAPTSQARAKFKGDVHRLESNIATLEGAKKDLLSVFCTETHPSGVPPEVRARFAHVLNAYIRSESQEISKVLDVLKLLDVAGEQSVARSKRDALNLANSAARAHSDENLAPTDAQKLSRVFRALDDLSAAQPELAEPIKQAITAARAH